MAASQLSLQLASQPIMPFNRIATTAWMLCALLGFSSPLPAETIQFYFDSATPQIAFAAGD